MLIKEIDLSKKIDIRLPNEPFALFGRMVPSFQDGVWSFREELFPPEDVTEMTFPEEAYDFETMSRDCVFVGAYEDNQCIGLAIWQRSWNRYLYLYDLKVCRAFRGKGTGAALIKHGKHLAGELGYLGLYTVGQDNNLGACRFYLRQGFALGGFDDHVYRGTTQEGKADLHFYLDL